MKPLVSIILPAYNSAKYLSLTIESLLNQTYTNFELLIIDDGSTDNTSQIIDSYKDSRIKHIKNDGNKGLIYTLNKGIELANGEFIARIDADDICLPKRLEKQVQFLEENKNIALVATQIQTIDEHGNNSGNWPLDIQKTTTTSIKKRMAWENCIAHPSIMFRAAIIKNYRYSIHQKNTEDYALWLELLADGFLIAKIPEQLLLYRVHTQSITVSFHRKRNSFFINFNTKGKFLQGRLSRLKFGIFETKVFITMLHDLLMGIGKEIKNKLKS